MDIIHLVKEGGFVMYPLVICSLLIWAVIFEKYWGIFQFNKNFEDLHKKAAELLQQKKIDEAKGLFFSADTLIAGPHLALLANYKSQELRDEKVTRELIQTQTGLKRFMWVLATIASSAPFIGLFGTVVGIIRSFDSMASTGKGGFSVVAAGLSEALIATASGILVAVVALIFYNYFTTKLAEVNQKFKHKLEDLSDLLS